MRADEFIKILIALIAICAGLFAIFAFVKNVELTIGLISLTFGILAMIWTLRARAVLSIGSSLRKYTEYFFLCLLFILLYSIWNTSVVIFGLEGFKAYFKYVFLTLAYLVFVIAAYQILKLGKEFGFNTEAKRIKKVLKTKKSGK